MTRSTATGQTVRLNGIDLHFNESGEGEPLMLLHGFTGAGVDWNHVFNLDALSREHRLIIPDARGHGRSSNPSGGFTIRQCASDALALLDHLKVDRLKAIGMSLGAKTLLHTATQQPNRFEAMVLVSAAPYFPEQARDVMRASKTAEHSPGEWAEMRARHAFGDGQIHTLWAIAAGFADSYDDMTFSASQLATITARTLIVSGDCDPLYPAELALEMHRAIPSSALWIVPGGAHCPVFGNDSTRFAQTALRFLAHGGRQTSTENP